jgi:hypothetical protein
VCGAKERTTKGFPPKPSTILASRKKQKLSSNDLAELDLEPVDHHQIPIDPLQHR